MLLNLANRFAEISRVLLAFLGLNLVLVNVMLPFLAFALFTDALAALPAPAVVAVGAGAWALSGPGIAAAFAACRDAHLLRLTEAPEAREKRAAVARQIPAVAPSYWREDEDTRIVRPFLRAFVRVGLRALAVSMVSGVAVAVLAVSALTALHTTGVDALAAALIALTGLAVVAGLAALGLVVELPRARTLAAVRTALQLVARRPLPAVALLAVLAAYGYTLLAWPLLVLTIGSALLLFFAAHLVHAITSPVIETVVAEESAVLGTGSPAGAPPTPAPA